MYPIFNFFYKLIAFEGHSGKGLYEEWPSFLIWIFVISDFVLAVFFVTSLLLLFVKFRRDPCLFSPRLFYLSLVLLLFCGVNFLLEVLIHWLPVFSLYVMVHLLASLLAIFTAYFLYIDFLITFNPSHALKKVIQEKTEALEDANRKLASSELTFKTLVDSNPDLISILDHDYRHKFINQAYSQALEQPPSFFLGKRLEELGFSEATIETHLSHMKDAFEKGRKVEYESISYLPQGKRIYSNTIIPLEFPTSQKGTTTELFFLSRDITHQKSQEVHLKKNIRALKKLSDSLSQRNQKLQDYSEILSHNLRSPVGNLESLSRLLKTSKDQSEMNLFSEKIYDLSHSLRKTVDDLSDIIRNPEVGTKQNDLISFKEILGLVLESLSTEITDSQAEVQSEFALLPEIPYPRGYLQSIFYNLISNAIKYRAPERKPVIKLRTFIKGNHYQFICQDNGLGIDLARHGDKIFELYSTFHDLENSRGVGLHITKNQLEALGGSIRVESQVHQGSIFYVNFGKVKSPIPPGDQPSNLEAKD